jgi:hypothetical protein
MALAMAHQADGAVSHGVGRSTQEHGLGGGEAQGVKSRLRGPIQGFVEAATNGIINLTEAPQHGDYKQAREGAVPWRQFGQPPARFQFICQSLIQHLPPVQYLA